MIRVYVSVEGATEREFCSQVLEEIKRPPDFLLTPRFRF